MGDHVETISVRLIEQVKLRRELLRFNPVLIYPWWRPCQVDVLLVTDGALDFGMGDFGLSAFVNMMANDGRSYVRFNITLAHLRSDVTDAQVMKGASGIVASIKDFRFDNPTHFTASKFDEVWLFGFESFFHSSSYNYRNTHRSSYPADRLSDAELVALNAHMQAGGGVFATGDHGSLGRGLCGSVNRVRSMRDWTSHVVGGQDEVGMTNSRRNDTNQPGDAGSQFSDQSDDVPQRLDLKLYTSYLGGLRRETYPHPVLCGPSGRLDVLPDHPHEGECHVPRSLTTTFAPDGTEEYPAPLGGGARISPEVIATSYVRAGNVATLHLSAKDPTVAHSFGAISAYDGRPAGVGRVICDATWHHFVNVNLIGLVEGDFFDDLTPTNSPTKHDGFLSSPSGMAALAKIKDYFVNIGVWIAPPDRNQCFNNRIMWDVIFRDRIMEASLISPDIDLGRIPVNIFHHIGTSARDAVGAAAGQCRAVEWLIDLYRPIIPELVTLIDPWPPHPIPDPPPFTTLDPLQALDVGLGSAIVALRQAHPYPTDKLDENDEASAAKAIQTGLSHGLDLGLKQVSKDLRRYSRTVTASLRQAGDRSD